MFFSLSLSVQEADLSGHIDNTSNRYLSSLASNLSDFNEEVVTFYNGSLPLLSQPRVELYLGARFSLSLSLSLLPFTLHYVHVLMRDEKEGRKKQARSNKQTNKAKQHSTSKAVTFPLKNELPHVHESLPPPLDKISK